jgi:glycosyltransferase involved in cell wall biosynthesis
MVERMTMADVDTHPVGSAPREGALRILTVTNLWPENGQFRGIFVQEQVEAIRKLGHHVDVEVVAQSRGRRDYFLAARRVRRRVREGNYDVVHIHFGMTALAARFIGPVPRVLTLHGGDIHIWWQRWLTRLGWGGATRIYASRRLARSAHDPDATVIACGVDPELFTPADPTQARRQLGIAHNEPIVLFGALRGNPVKDYPLFAAVLDELRNRGQTVHELILAEPDQPRTRVAAKFAAADALLVTSKKGTESGPVVVKEAVLTDLPVVSVDVGDVPEVLEGVTPSHVVPWPEGGGADAARVELVHALADRLAEVLATRSRSNGRECTDRVDVNGSARAVAEVYRRVLGR